MSVFRSLNHFSWKQILVFNSLLLLSGFGLLTQHYLSQPTRTTGKAAPPAPAATPAPNYPTAAPKLQHIVYFYAKPLDTVRLKGSNLGAFRWDSHLSLSDATRLSPTSTATPIPSENILSWTDTYIDLVVPKDARSGYLTLYRGDGQVAQTPYPLVIYQDSTDPSLVLNTENGQEILSLQNAPHDSTLTLTLAPSSTVQTVFNSGRKTTGNTYEFSVNNDTELPILSGNNITIEHATLLSEDETVLPLFVQP